MKDPKDMTADELVMELTDGKGFTADMEGQAEIWSGKHVANKVAEACAATDRTAKAMAEATFTLLQSIATEWGYNPNEVIFREPHDERCYFDNGNSYVVAWESGPYEWGYHASMAIGEKAGKLAEPYYSFDVCFYPAEDVA